MKMLFENFVSTLVLVFMVFAVCCLTLGSMQTQVARRIHTYVINEVSSSYYQVSVDEINKSLEDAGIKNWKVNVCEITDPVCNDSTAYNNHSGISERKTWKVVLDYKTYIGLFDVVNNGRLVGYAN